LAGRSRTGSGGGFPGSGWIIDGVLREPVENNKWALCPFFFRPGASDGAPRRMAHVVARVTNELTALVERTVGGLGYELVDLERAGHGLLRVTLDTPHPGGIGLDDCEQVSRQLTHLFAVENVEYDRLEVSSPGLDRPLRGARDFARFVGAEVALQLNTPLDGRRRLRGTVLASGGEPGAEWIRLRESPPQPGPAAGKGRGVKGRKTAAPELPVVELALERVDKARLVPQVDFGSKARAVPAPAKERSQ
jgi:ribosome maturation factor RimP